MTDKQLLITVGTTKFEKLIENIDKDDFYKMAIQHGFNKIIIQKGTGEYIPKNYTKYEKDINVQVSTILKNFEKVIKSSELIISHGGAGIILESLRNKKKVIVCVNDLLMDNHQVELASSLDKEGYVRYAKKLENITKEVEDVLNETKAPIMYTCNIVTQPGETDNFTVGDHVKLLNRYLDKKKVDVVIANNAKIEEEIAKRYESQEQKDPVLIDYEELEKIGVELIEDNLLTIDDNTLKHDSLKLSSLIFSYLMRK